MFCNMHGKGWGKQSVMDSIHLGDKCRAFRAHLNTVFSICVVAVCLQIVPSETFFVLKRRPLGVLIKNCNISKVADTFKCSLCECRSNYIGFDRADRINWACDAIGPNIRVEVTVSLLDCLATESIHFQPDRLVALCASIRTYIGFIIKFDIFYISNPSPTRNSISMFVQLPSFGPVNWSRWVQSAEGEKSAADLSYSQRRNSNTSQLSYSV